MTVVVAWLRLDLRRRWRSLAVLALLIAVSSGTVLTAVAGARRGESALQRLEARTLPATAFVLPGESAVDWEAVRAMRQVETMATLTMSGMSFDGIRENNEIFYLPENPQLMRTIEAPVVLRGRLPDPSRADEAAATSRFVTTHGKDVGAGVTPLVNNSDQSNEVAPPTHAEWLPRQITIVGVVRSPLLSDDSNSPGQLILTPGLMASYRAHVEQPYLGGLVRLRQGGAGLPEFRAELARVTGQADVDVQDLADPARHRQRLAAFEARFLMAFGAAALAAALLLVGQAVARHTAASMAQLRIVRALGMTPRQAIRAAVAGPFLAAVIGGSAGVAAAAAASRWFPIGSASGYEPAPGMHPDWWVLTVGCVLVPVTVVAGGMAAAWWARSAQAPGSARRSSLAGWLVRAGAPVPVIVGARFALETGRGRTAVPARPALVGAIVGVLGVVAAFTFSSGIAEAAGNPRRFGQTFQLGVELGGDGERSSAAGAVLAAAAADPDVAGITDSRFGVATAVSGSGTGVTVFSYEPVGQPPDVVVTSGGMPASASEIVLGPESAAALGVDVGAEIELAGSGGRRTMTVSGIGFVVEGWRNSHASGGWVTGEGFDGLFDGFIADIGFVEVRPGAVVEDVRARLTRVSAAVTGDDGLPFGQAPPPLRIGEIRQVRGLPVVLGVFLVVLAVSAVGHALATAVRRRRYDLAVLRAVGMTRRQSRGVVLTQATVLAIVGLVFGVPLGVALGRILWRVVADYTPVEYAPPVAFWALLLVAPLTLLAANLLAAWPGRQAARLRVGDVLRAE